MSEMFFFSDALRHQSPLAEIPTRPTSLDSVQVHGPKGFFDDPQTMNIDLKRFRKRREDTVKAARLIKDRGRTSALDVLWSRAGHGIRKGRRSCGVQSASAHS